MAHCSISGKRCDCLDTFVRDPHDPNGQFPSSFDQHGIMPKRCEGNLPLPMVVLYRRNVSAALRDEYDRWVKAGQPKLSEWRGEPDEDAAETSAHH